MSITATITLKTDGTGQGNANQFTHGSFTCCNGNHGAGGTCDGTTLEITTEEDVTVKVTNSSEQLGGYYKTENDVRTWQDLSGDGGSASFALSGSLTLELAGSQGVNGVFTTLTLTKVTPKPA